MQEMAQMYGYDISKPASKCQGSNAMDLFCISCSYQRTKRCCYVPGQSQQFFDIYIERDIQNGLLTEKEAQELVDHFVMKLRMARHLRTPDYNELFGWRPNVGLQNP